MKKFRSLICIMFILVLGIFFVGCKTPEDTDEVTLSLSDAKSMVVESL